MFDTSRDPFEELRRQWGGAQERALDVFPAMQRRAERDEQRADQQASIEREEARFQTQREDALAAEARQRAQAQLQQLDAALAQLDPENPEDKPEYDAGVAAREYLLGVLGETGANALSALSTGRVNVDGTEMTVGQAVAAAGAASTGAQTRRTEEAADAAARRQRERDMLGFEFEAGEAEKAREFEALMRQADMDFRRGMTLTEIAARQYEQMTNLGFQGTQADLERALQREIEAGRIGLEVRKLNAAESAAERDALIADIEGLDLSNPDDQEILDATLAAARASGMLPTHIRMVENRARAQAGTRAQLGFRGLRAEVEGLEAGTAVTRAQADALEYGNSRQAVLDGQADVGAFQQFVVSTTALGRMGVETLQVMLQHYEEGREDSPYAAYFDQMDPEVLQAAIDKAGTIAEDETTERAIWLSQARAALVRGQTDEMAAVASYMDPKELQDLLDAPDDDPRFQGEVGATLRFLRDQMRASPALAASAARQAGLRIISESQPRIASAQQDLSFYAQQRPENIEQGAAAVRRALQTLADVGLFGDPGGDESITAQAIEDQVSFYLRAWGDQEGMFNAELAEMASRTALNNANARRIAAQGALGEAGEGSPINFDQLEFFRDTIDQQISAVMERANAIGCTFASSMDRATTAAGVDPETSICNALEAEIASYQADYDNIIRMGGYLTPTEQAERAWRQRQAEEIDARYPTWTDEQKRAELQRRWDYYTSPLTPLPAGQEGPRLPAGGAASTGPEWAATTTPPAAPAAPQGPSLAGEAVGNIGGALDSAGRAVGAAWDAVTRPFFGPRPAPEGEE